jgi:hypothetical protein
MKEMPKVWEGMFANVRDVPGQGLCVVQRFIFTTGLLTHVRFVGLTYDYAARYCYETLGDAMEDLATWNGENDPPGRWIKEKVSERSNPSSAESQDSEGGE